MKTELLKTDEKYAYWRLTDDNGQEFWNITPRTDQPPEGGYKSKEYIERIKHARFDNGVL